MAGYDWLGGLLGRAPQQVDPYKEDRELRMNALRGAMGQYDNMMSNGPIPQSYKDQMLGDTEKSIRNMNPGAGQSGYTNDRVVKGQNDLRVKMLDTEMNQLNKQRDYMSSLVGMNQPTQQQPGQTGMLQQIGGDLAGRAARSAGDAIMGQQQPNEDELMRKAAKWFGMYGTGRQNGMNVGGEGNY